MTKLIGITGKLGAGKDCSWLAIQQWAEDNSRIAVRQAFADKLKISAARALGINGADEALVAIMNSFKNAGSIYFSVKDHLNDELTGEISGREYLQRYGTEAHREVFTDNFWVDALLPLPKSHSLIMTKITDHKWVQNFDNADFAVVTDVRFPNESERIKELGGDIWQIRRAEHEEISDKAIHASEAGIPSEHVDWVFLNDGSIEQLHEKIKRHLNDYYL